MAGVEDQRLVAEPLAQRWNALRKHVLARLPEQRASGRHLVGPLVPHLARDLVGIEPGVELDARHRHRLLDRGHGRLEGLRHVEAGMGAVPVGCAVVRPVREPRQHGIVVSSGSHGSVSLPQHTRPVLQNLARPLPRPDGECRGKALVHAVEIAVPAAAQAEVGLLRATGHRHHLVMKGVEWGEHQAATVRCEQPEREDDGGTKALRQEEEAGERGVGVGRERELGVEVTAGHRRLRQAALRAKVRARSGPGDAGTLEAAARETGEATHGLGSECQQRALGIGAHLETQSLGEGRVIGRDPRLERSQVILAGALLRRPQGTGIESASPGRLGAQPDAHRPQPVRRTPGDPALAPLIDPVEIPRRPQCLHDRSRPLRTPEFASEAPRLRKSACASS